MTDEEPTKAERREKKRRSRRNMKVSGAGLRDIWRKILEKSRGRHAAK